MHAPSLTITSDPPCILQRAISSKHLLLYVSPSDPQTGLWLKGQTSGHRFGAFMHEPSLTIRSDSPGGSLQRAISSKHLLLYVSPSDPQTGLWLKGQTSGHSSEPFDPIHKPSWTIVSDSPGGRLQLIVSNVHWLLYDVPSDPQTGALSAKQSDQWPHGADVIGATSENKINLICSAKINTINLF